MLFDKVFVKNIKLLKVVDLKNIDFLGNVGLCFVVMFLVEFIEGVEYIYFDVVGIVEISEVL